jgi:hypothetical protein
MVILSGIILAIGGAVWSYSLGAASSAADSYVNSTMTLLEEVTESFIIEHIYYNNASQNLVVWIYNYGEAQITLDFYADVDRLTAENDPSPIKGIKVPASEHQSASFPSNLLSEDQVLIKVYSRRQNCEQILYEVP